MPTGTKHALALIAGLASAAGGVIVLLPDWKALLAPTGIGGLMMVLGSVVFMWSVKGLTGIQDELARQGRLDRRKG